MAIGDGTSMGASRSPGVANNDPDLMVTTLQDIARAINNLAQVMENVFPQQGATATSATAGGATALPALPAAYLDVVVNGASRKIPLYNS